MMIMKGYGEDLDVIHPLGEWGSVRWAHAINLWISDTSVSFKNRTLAERIQILERR